MSTKDKDLETWKQWNKTKSPQDASVFINQMLPLVKNDIYRHSSNAPYPVMEAHGKQLILQAGAKYNPYKNKNTSIATFVKSYMPKLNQISAEMRTPMRVPESRSYKFGLFKNSYEKLADRMKREPTIAELADDLKWSKAEVTRFLQEWRGEFTQDRPFVSTYVPNSSYEEDLIDYVYHDLSSQEKLLFEYTTGYGGKPKLSNDEIMKRLNWNQNKLSYEKTKLSQKIEGMLNK